MQEKIELLKSTDPYFNDKFANKVLNKAQLKANESGENVYICYDVGTVYYVYHNFLTLADDVITFVEPA